MDKFTYCFFPTLQFVLGVIATICFTIGFGYHLLSGNCPFFIAVLLILAWLIVHGLTVKAYKEMRQAYKEEPYFPPFEDEEEYEDD